MHLDLDNGNRITMGADEALAMIALLSDAVGAVQVRGIAGNSKTFTLPAIRNNTFASKIYFTIEKA